MLFCIVKCIMHTSQLLLNQNNVLLVKSSMVLWFSINILFDIW